MKPEFDPPLPRFVAWLNSPDGGGWGLGADGGIFALGGAPFRGCTAGKDYFAGRTAAKLWSSDNPELAALRGAPAGPPGGYVIQTTSGEFYGPQF